MYCQQRTLQQCCVLTNTRIRSVIFQSYSFHLYWYLLVGHFQFLCRRLQSSDVCSVKPRLHDTTCCQPVVKLVWQPVVSCIQTFNWLSYPFDYRFDNRLYRVYSRLSNRLYNPVWQSVKRTVAVRSTRLSNRVCQTSLRTVLNEQPLFVQPVVNRLNVCIHDTTGCHTRLTTGWQPVVSCIQTFNWLSNRLTTGLTTDCTV